MKKKISNSLKLFKSDFKELLAKKEAKYIVPNFFTASRIILSVGILTLAISGNILGAFGLAIIGAVSDKIDGWAASILNAKSQFGAKMDILGDKWFNLMNFISLGVISPTLLTIASITTMAGLELGISYNNTKAYGDKKNVGSSYLGKAKTVAMCSFFALSYLTKLNNNTILQTLTIISSLATVGLQSLALTQYAYNGKKSQILPETKENENIKIEEPKEEQISLTKTIKPKYTGYREIEESPDLGKLPFVKKDYKD